MSTLLERASLIFDSRLQAWKTGKLFPVKPVVKDLTGDFFEFTRGDVATYTDKDGILRTAQAGQPRFQFKNGVNKGLWIEPSATNLYQRSEEFNLSWVKARVTVTDNTTLAPDGTLTADSLIEDSSADNNHQIFQDVALLGGQSYVLSCYMKAGNRNWGGLRFGNANNLNCWFDLQNGIVGSADSGLTTYIERLSNGWYRCVAILASSATTTGCSIFLANADNSFNYTGDGTSGIFIWGAQLEAGSVATSYIKTEGATVTRPADVATITDASDLIGQTEGTVLVEVDYRPGRVVGGIIDLDSASGLVDSIRIIGSSSVGFGNDFISITRGVDSDFSPMQLQAGRNKIGLQITSPTTAYLYVNGIKSTLATFTALSVMTRINIGCRTNGSAIFNDTISQAIIFKQALTDDEVRTWTQL